MRGACGPSAIKVSLPVHIVALHEDGFILANEALHHGCAVGPCLGVAEPQRMAELVRHVDSRTYEVAEQPDPVCSVKVHQVIAESSFMYMFACVMAFPTQE